MAGAPKCETTLHVVFALQSGCKSKRRHRPVSAGVAHRIPRRGRHALQVDRVAANQGETRRWDGQNVAGMRPLEVS